FADELALISYPLDYDDYRTCDIESDMREIEFLLFQEMFTEEQPLDYSFPPRFDVYPDDFLEIQSDATFDDDSFDSEGEKIKEVDLLIDQLDLPCDILSKYDSFNSQDFSRDDVLFSPDNEDKVFNPGILSHEKSVKIITHITQEKKLAVSFASWLSEDFDPPFYELFVFKEVPNSLRLLPFSSENDEKVFKPGIYTFKEFHCCFLSELSHPGPLGIISDFKDSIDQSVLTHCDDLFVDPTPEMFAEEQPSDYSFPPRFDVYPDDFLEIESDATFDHDSFDSEGEKIKEAELLIDPLDLPCDILSEYDSFNSQDFSRDDVLFSPDNEDKLFSIPGFMKILANGFHYLKSLFSPLFNLGITLKKAQEKDKIESKPDKNGMRVEAEKSLKQLQ
nr:hypothetical protein [Tanacetum cinerariifolium]